MRKSEYRKFRKRIDDARNKADAKCKHMAELRPMALRLGLMLLWAKITGRS